MSGKNYRLRSNIINPGSFVFRIIPEAEQLTTSFYFFITPIIGSMKLTINEKQIYFEFRNGRKDRPTLVFLHDSLGCTQLWRDFPYRLADITGCNVLIYDRIGYGKSDPMPSYFRMNNYMEIEAKILNEILITLNIGNSILFGHSDGGTIALIAASLYPGRITGLISEAAHIFVEEITLQGIHEAIATYKTTNLAERLAKYHGDKVDILFRAWTETWTREDYRDWSIEHLLTAIQCPVLFIQGEKDEYGSLEQVERTLSLVNGKSEKLILPGISHSPHKESMENVLKTSAEFIREITG